jgi:hypothetical protein
MAARRREESFMELSDLDHDERVALVVLVELVGESNAEVTEEEAGRIDAVAQALGDEEYRRLAAEADERCPDEAAIRAALRAVKRQEARELIYGTALEVAAGDAIRGGESDLLDWLAGEWGIEVKLAEPIDVGPDDEEG